MRSTLAVIGTRARNGDICGMSSRTSVALVPIGGEIRHGPPSSSTAQAIRSSIDRFLNWGRLPRVCESVRHREARGCPDACVASSVPVLKLSRCSRKRVLMHSTIFCPGQQIALLVVPSRAGHCAPGPGNRSPARPALRWRPFFSRPSFPCNWITLLNHCQRFPASS